VTLFPDLTGKALSRWMLADGPESDTVISSRVRLARNIEGLPFPHLMTPERGEKVIEMVRRAFASKDAAKLGLDDAEVIRMSEMSVVDRQVLVEKHLISPNLARNSTSGAAAITPDESVSVMINEEDHIRIQCLYAGLQLREALYRADRVDDLLEGKMEYAFSENRGYLTACPTNVGTGMRASVMVHLPALVINNKAGQVFTTVVKLGFIVRGLYGEGTEAVGNIFQVSNQVTLGQSEADIVQNLRNVVEQIIAQEKEARESLMSEMKEQIEDKVGRAYGILLYGHVFSSKEAMQYLSDVRLGVDLGLLPQVNRQVLNELLVAIRPGYLQKMAGRELDPWERDTMRADLIRSRLRPDGQASASAPA